MRRRRYFGLSHASEETSQLVTVYLNMPYPGWLFQEILPLLTYPPFSQVCGAGKIRTRAVPIEPNLFNVCANRIRSWLPLGLTQTGASRPGTARGSRIFPGPQDTLGLPARPVPPGQDPRSPP